MEISGDQLVVGQETESSFSRTTVNVEDVLPLNWYTQGISVMYYSEILKNQSQMVDYIHKQNAIPAAFGLFPHLHELKVISSSAG